MKALLLAALSVVSMNVVHAEGNERPIKFSIHSADPWFVKLMLEGANPPMPELSTLWILRGMPQTTRGAKGLLDGGSLIVNPTDNSLWWIPDPKKA